MIIILIYFSVLGLIILIGYKHKQIFRYFKKVKRAKKIKEIRKSLEWKKLHSQTLGTKGLDTNTRGTSNTIYYSSPYSTCMPIEKMEFYQGLPRGRKVNKIYKA